LGDPLDTVLDGTIRDVLVIGGGDLADAREGAALGGVRELERRFLEQENVPFLEPLRIPASPGIVETGGPARTGRVFRHRDQPFRHAGYSLPTSIFAQVSRRATARFHTGRPGIVSLRSAQK